MNLINQIGKDLRIPEALIAEAMRDAYRLIKKVKIPKRDGTFREAYQPTQKLKLLQYWLIQNVFSKMPCHNTAHAYKQGASIIKNAERHKNGIYFLRIDFKDFFTSISYYDLLPHLQKWHLTSNSSWPLDKVAEGLILRSCFGKNQRLVVGFPASPSISNLIMEPFDEKIYQWLTLNKANLGECTYTRYADDLVFSTDKKGSCTDIKNSVYSFVGSLNSPKLKINENKTSFRSKPGGSAVVTGLRICQDGHITIPKPQKDHIRLLLSLTRKKNLSPKEERSLLSHLHYVRHTDPGFFTKLQLKYFDVIQRLIRPE